MKRYVYIYALCIIIVLCLPMSSLAASHPPAHPDAKFTQRILPMQCQFQTINDGLNTIIYLTPAICQPVVVPSHQPQKTPVTAVSQFTNPKNSSRGTIIPPLNNPVDSLNGHNRRVVELNHYSAVKSKRGWLVRSQVGAVYRYRPLDDSKQGTVHQMTIANISLQGVTILLQPSNQLFSLTPGQEIKADYSQQGKPTIAIRLVGRPSFNEVTLRIRLLSAKLFTQDTNMKDWPALWLALVAVAGLLGLGLAYRSLHHIIALRFR
jgi:hypothetical protein